MCIFCLNPKRVQDTEEDGELILSKSDLKLRVHVLRDIELRSGRIGYYTPTGPIPRVKQYPPHH